MSTDPKTAPARHVAAVVLNYNSAEHLKICIERLRQQDYPSLSIIVVDNASEPDCVEEIENWLKSQEFDVRMGSTAEITAEVEAGKIEQPHGFNCFIKNDENGGYGKGNNIGLRVAEGLGAEASLIVNPDVQLQNNDDVSKLVARLFDDDDNLVVAPRALDPEGNDQYPLRPWTFKEEILIPRGPMRLFTKKMPDRLVNVPMDRPSIVEEVVGCCLLVRMPFFKAYGYFDEDFFLYYEEEVMNRMIDRQGGNLIFEPAVKIFHDHLLNRQGDVLLKSYLLNVSRKLLLKKYSTYPFWQNWILQGYYSFVNRTLAKRLRQRG
jgi:GT2 family glycosyltransferase